MPEYDEVYTDGAKWFGKTGWSKQDGHWTLIPDLLMKDKRLPANAKLAYVILLSEAKRLSGGEAGWIQYPETWLARDLNADPKSVRNWLRLLEDFGFIEIDKVQQRTAEGYTTPKLYLVNDPKDVQYEVQIDQATALNHRRRLAPAPRASARPAGHQPPASGKIARPTSKKEKQAASNEVKEEAASNNEASDLNEDVHDEAREAVPRPQDLSSPVQSSSSSVIGSDSVEVDDRLHNDEMPQQQEPTDDELLERAIRAAFGDTSMADTLCALSQAEIVALARTDEDGPFIIGSQKHRANREMWFQVIVKMAGKVLGQSPP